MKKKISNISMTQVIDNYKALFFDAYGVLCTAQGALPGAIELIDKLNSMQKNYWILTNGATRSIEKTAKSYQEKGLAIKKENIISSGSMIGDWFTEKELYKPLCLVLGPTSACELLQEQGARAIHIEDLDKNKDEIEVLVISNQTGYDFLSSINKVINFLFKELIQKKAPEFYYQTQTLFTP